MSRFWIVLVKELVDALRDRRTLFTVLISSVAMGPLVLVLLSTMIGNIEKRADAREMVVVGLQHAPTLRNYLERQTFTLTEAPADFEKQLKDSKLGDPVLVVGETFEAELAAGEVPVLELVTASANQRAEAGVGRVNRVLQGFNQEQAMLRMSMRGVSPASLQAMAVQERDLSNASARAAQLTSMLPFFILMAVLYGCLAAALDTTAGERERGSLEPLLMNPTGRFTLVAGKWGAVAAIGWLIGALGCLSFLPGQWLLRSETLAAMFRYGWVELAGFLAVLTPLVGALAALLMALAIRCKTFKEAQANAAVMLTLVSLLPMLALFNQEGEQPWHLMVPVLAQFTLMGRVLRGEAMGTLDLLIPAAMSVALAVLALAYVARQLSRAAVK
ncbi:MAG: ABC transporter permease subunit [Ideonella sp.]|nr:ABC transporter permease subunit [Ideonella sp.]